MGPIVKGDKNYQENKVTLSL